MAVREEDGLANGVAARDSWNGTTAWLMIEGVAVGQSMAWLLARWMRID